MFKEYLWNQLYQEKEWWKVVYSWICVILMLIKWALFWWEAWNDENFKFSVKCVTIETNNHDGESRWQRRPIWSRSVSGFLLPASCLFNNNDGKLNVNTLREKGFICVETHLTALEICEQKKCQIFPFTKRRVVVLLGRWYSVGVNHLTFSCLWM